MHIPVAIVAAWEDVVIDERAKEFVRCYAWHRLLKLWTGMRFSDMCMPFTPAFDSVA